MYQQNKLLFCKDHQNEQITNFCESPDCKLILCPECIPNHTFWHKTRNSFPEIRSFRQLK
jgi:hypothetical protein